MLPQISNISKATAVGMSTGAGGTIVASYVAQVIELKYGVPQFVTLAVLGTGYGFVMNWAAKLQPHG